MNNAQINALAYQFAQNNDAYAFNDLVRLVYNPVIRSSAVQYGRRHRIGTDDDFESYFMEAAWEAAKDYDGAEDYLPRLRKAMKRKKADVVREATAKKRTLDREAVSLDTLVEGKDGEEIPLVEMVQSPIDTPEKEFEVKEKVKAFFEQTNGQSGQIMRMLLDGASKEKVAAKLGESGYSTKVRQAVSRAKRLFRDTLLN